MVKNEKPTAFLECEHIYFRPHELEDLEKFYKWFNDPEIKRLIGETQPLSKMESKEKLEGWIKDKNSISLSILTKKDNILIGTIGLIKIDNVHRRAELGIIIGEKNYWSKRYGQEAIRIILNYGFDRLNLNRIYLGMVDINERAKKTYEKIGFIQEGMLREHFYIDGKYHNRIIMGILREEWRKRRKNVSL